MCSPENRFANAGQSLLTHQNSRARHVLPHPFIGQLKTWYRIILVTRLFHSVGFCEITLDGLLTTASHLSECIALDKPGGFFSALAIAQS